MSARHILASARVLWLASGLVALAATAADPAPAPTESKKVSILQLIEEETARSLGKGRDDEKGRADSDAAKAAAKALADERSKKAKDAPAMPKALPVVEAIFGVNGRLNARLGLNGTVHTVAPNDVIPGFQVITISAGGVNLQVLCRPDEKACNPAKQFAMFEMTPRPPAGRTGADPQVPAGLRAFMPQGGAYLPPEQQPIALPPVPVPVTPATTGR